MEWRGPGFGSAAGSGQRELDPFDSESDHEDHFNVASVRMTGRRQTRHVTNEPGKIVGTRKDKAQLEADAKEIHSVLGTGEFSGSTTVVCAVFEVQGGYLYVATVNNALMDARLRPKAEALGYSLIYGVQTHAEGNLLLYEHKHIGDARLLDFGCDKDSCPECVELLQKLSVEGLAITPRPPRADGSEAFTSRYYFRGKSKNPKGDQGPFAQRMGRIIRRNYGEDGRKLPHAAEEEDFPAEESHPFKVKGMIRGHEGKFEFLCKDEAGEDRILSNEELKRDHLMEYMDYLESHIKIIESAE